VAGRKTPPVADGQERVSDCGPPFALHGRAYHHPCGMTDDELEELRRITKRRQRAEAEWRQEILRLFDAGHSIEQIAAAAGVRYDDILAIVRPR